MQIEYRAEELTQVECDLLAYPIFIEDAENPSALELLNKVTAGAVQSILSSGEFKPDLHKTFKIFNPAGLKARYLFLIGAGKKSQFEPSKLREIAGNAVRSAKSCAAKTIAFASRDNNLPGVASRLAVEGAIYADYESDIYKTQDKENNAIEKLFLLFERVVSSEDVNEGIRRGTIVGEATNVARTLANEPSNILTPSQFAERAMIMGSQAGLSVQILEHDEMARMGMNTLLAVSRGSEEPPKLIVLRNKKSEAIQPNAPLYAMVGKGVTFDSGGISIKPSEKMEEMKADMAGGAAVLGAMIALSKLPSQNPIIGLIPAVENLPSGKATKPGDVVTSYLGKTVEIINTDAEGRLILADAIAYAKELGASRIIDVATLTGACVVALGHVNAGMMGTDQETINTLRENCRITGEGLWQLPLDDEYGKAIKSEIADLKNVGDRAAGAITAAKFLQEFVEETPWVHLDIAGMDLNNESRPFACKGATGFGVRTLVQLFE